MVIDRILNANQLQMVRDEIKGYNEQARKLEDSGAKPLALEYRQLFAPRIADLEAKIARYEFLAHGGLPAIPLAGQNPGVFLTEMRISQKMTQETLAKRVDVVQSTIAKYEAREYAGCDDATVLKVSAALGLKAELRGLSFSFTKPAKEPVAALKA